MMTILFDEAEARGEARGELRGISIGEKRGEERGKINTLISLVEDGTITEEQAAKKAKMSVADFKKTYLSPVVQ